MTESARLDQSADLCSKIISHEFLWSGKAVKQAKKCLGIISELRQSEQIEYPQYLLHEITILASLCASSKPRIEV